MRREPAQPRWVIIAEHRTERPSDFDAQATAEPTRKCPFCRGNEQATPHETAAYRDEGSAEDDVGWRVRSVTNRYPALLDMLRDRWEGDPDADVDASSRPAQAMLPGFGLHEVIIETPEHLLSLSDLSPEAAGDVFRMYRDRLLALSDDPEIAHATIFKNVGAAAGASLEHTHSQLIATPITPPRVQEKTATARGFFESHGRCLYCDMIERELQAGDRVVFADDRFVALCPYASRFPFEVWVLPRKHASHLGDADDATCLALGGLMRDLLARIETVTRLALSTPNVLVDLVQGKVDAFSLSEVSSGNGKSVAVSPTGAVNACDAEQSVESRESAPRSILTQPAYNYIIHSGEFRRRVEAFFHFHVEIMPALVKPAGFEWGSGMHINPVAPEHAAACLRALAEMGR